MSWVYLDDKFHSNPKVIAMGNAAAGLYARALSYCGDHLTDGYIPEGWAKTAGTRAQRERLLSLGAWVTVDGGYQIPDYLTLNPSKEKVEAKRAARAAAGALGGKQRGKQNGSNSQANASGDASVLPPVLLGSVPTPQPQPQNPSPTTEARSVGVEVRMNDLEESKAHALRLVTSMREGKPHRGDRTTQQVLEYAGKLHAHHFDDVRERMLFLRHKIKSDGGWALSELQRLAAA